MEDCVEICGAQQEQNYGGEGQNSGGNPLTAMAPMLCMSEHLVGTGI